MSAPEPGAAFAKAILVGEHAVVSGHAALVAGLRGGIACRVVGPAPELCVTVKAWDLAARGSDDGLPGRAVAALHAALVAEGVSPDALRVSIEGRPVVPPGVGLGSSAAFAVAVVRAVAVHLDRPDLAEAETVARLAGASETVFHGNASGVDAAVAARGGLGLFRRGKGLTPVTSARPAVLVVAESGPRPPTRDMVAQVQAKARTEPAAARALARLGALAEGAAEALSAGELDAAGEALREARVHLAALGLATEALDALCDAALDAGALGAKLTGAGGGGCLVALCTPDRAGSVQSALARRARWSHAFPLTPEAS